MGSAAEERHRHTGASPKMGHKDNGGTGASHILAERSGTVQPREQKSQGGCTNVYRKK